MMILSSQYGQLCNRLFTYANLQAFAWEHGLRLLNPGFHDYAPLFPQTARAAGMTRGAQWVARRAMSVCRRVWRSRTLCIGETEPLYLDAPENRDTADRLCRHGFWLLDGFYFIDRRAFPRHADRLREFFRPHEGDRVAAEQCVGAARTRAEIVVGVHVRRGDYRAFNDGAFMFSDDEYAAAMAACRHLHPGASVAFVIASNEPVRTDGFPPPLDVSAGPGAAAGDLHALACCDLIIGPPSTFSQWASFAGRVPRFMMQRDRMAPHSLDQFGIHTTGFGRYV